MQAITLKLEEQNLIEACRRQERWAQEQLYKEFYSPMMAICQRYTRNNDDALDILQEGYIKVFNNLQHYVPHTSLLAWIRRIMINTAIDQYRKNVRRYTESLDTQQHVTIQDSDPTPQLSADELLEVVQSISPMYRMVFNLYVMEGYSHKEIGDLLGITESTSRSNLVKARMKIKEIILSKINRGG